uniref:ATP synthase complex subunit 8 n=1 Tax=Pselaphinae sp. 6 EF-2015 TaxID=1756860 RepID=A0A0S2M8Q5_9COLE|nr:ATP synthase F0 subunit 8 [Pselaphinae sp. 6 EF-2015]
MPQMAPLFWLILFIFFTLIFFMVNLYNYYLMKKYPNKILLIPSLNKNYWKW